MNVSHADFYSDGSLMLNDLVSFGSLLNLVNAVKCKRMRVCYYALFVYNIVINVFTIIDGFPKL